MTKEKLVCLISGGIDSPVAAVIASRHFDIVPLHFSLYPFYCAGSFELTIEIMKALKKETKFKSVLLYPHAEVLSKILNSGKLAREYMCVLCRKSMFKAAERVCASMKADGIVTGESLAQKASQTLQNMAVTTHGLKYPVLRPLLAMDKQEIKDVSEKLKMPEKHVGCCTATPERPTTKAKQNKVNELFKRLELQEIVDRNFRKVVEIDLTKKAEEYMSIMLDANE